MLAQTCASTPLALSRAGLHPSSGLCRLPARPWRPSRRPCAIRSQQAPTEQKESSSKDGRAAVAEAVPRSTAGRSVLSAKQEGASTDLAVILPRLKEVCEARDRGIVRH